MLLELYPIFATISIWSKELANERIIFHTDNEALVSILNKFTSKEASVMFLLRKLVIVCMLNNIQVQAQHIFGVSNCLADSLSRSQITKFKRLAPWAEEFPTPIPDYLLPQSLNVS